MRGELVVVFGGSGFIGKQVVRALAQRGARIRAVMRRPNLGHELRVMGDVGQVQLMQGNIRFPESVERALDGADAVVNLVAVLSESGKQSFEALHIEGARAIAEACAKRGVKRLVHVSALGAGPSGAKYARTKYRGERAVLEQTPGATILRPSIVFGPEDAFFNRFGAMAQAMSAVPFGFLPLIGGGKTRFQPIFVGDVADAVCAALAQPEARGRVYELGGPGIYTFKELMQFLLSQIDRRVPLAPIPFFLAQPLGVILEGLFKLVPFADPPLTGDQVAMLKRDNIVGADPNADTIAELGVAPLETIESITPNYLWRFRPYGQFQTRQNPA